MCHSFSKFQVNSFESETLYEKILFHFQFIFPKVKSFQLYISWFTL